MYSACKTLTYQCCCCCCRLWYDEFNVLFFFSPKESLPVL